MMKMKIRGPRRCSCEKEEDDEDEEKEEEEPTISISERLKWDPAVDHFQALVGSSCVPQNPKNALVFEALDSKEVTPWNRN